MASPARAHCVAIGVFAALAAVVAQAQAPFTYQGQLRQNGDPVNGSFSISFSLFDAPAGGNQIGTTLTSNVSITDGLFTRELDFGANSLVPGEDRWLEVQIGANPPMAPRAKVLPAPEAHGARNLRLPFTGAATVASPDCVLSITNAGTGGAVCGANTSATGTGVMGQASGGGRNIGVHGKTTSGADNSTGVYGEALGGAGATNGVYGYNTSTAANATGVFGFSDAVSGNTKGVWGRTKSTTNLSTGVFGEAQGTTGRVYGVRGETRSSGGNSSGVYGEALGGGATNGVFGYNNSTTDLSTGVYGLADGASGNTKGVWGESRSPTDFASGVFGIATGGAGHVGRVFGIRGRTDSTSDNAAGVFGESFGGNTVGVWGQTASAVSGAAGVFGRSSNGPTSGVYGLTFSTDDNAAGVFGLNSAATGAGVGVWGRSDSPTGYGGYFSNSANGYALWANGKTSTHCLELTGGCDVAEPFAISADVAAGTIQPGMVVAIDAKNPGKLRLADAPYDGAVAGIISGANNVNPGMVLQGDPGSGALGEHPVALTGRVYGWCDASYGAISPGDRLTTSATPGHAMRVGDPARAPGAVIGKAMTGLAEGRGYVLILVQPQ